MDGRAHPVSELTLARLVEVGSSTLTGTLFDRGFNNQYLTGLGRMAGPAGTRMVGRARTLRFIPLREDLVERQYADLANAPHRLALDSIGPGEVLVMDVGGFVGAGVLGDMFLRRIRELGGRGAVIDGAFRDRTAVQSVGLPVFARAVHGGAIPHRLMSAGRDEPIRCGGVAIIPGDVIVGDDDGVVAVPAHSADDIAAEAFDHAERERWMRERLDAGGALRDYYPPTGDHVAELERWLQARRSGSES